MRRIRSRLRIIVTLIKSFIGTGIIFLPGTFRISGILSGNILSSIVCILAIISLRLLVKCCEGNESLSELAERVWGKFGLLLIDSSIFFSQLGFSTVYMIFIAHSIQEIVYSVSSCQIEIPIIKLVCFQMVVYLPFIFLRDIENLGFPSVLANISVFSVLIIIFHCGIQNIIKNPIGRPPIFDPGNIYGAGLVLGTSAFNYEGVALILPIRSSTPESIINEFPKILTITMVFIGIFSNIFASFVYYSFGEDTSSPVTGNILSPKVKLISLTIYSIAITFSVPLQLFPSMGIAERYIFRNKTDIDIVENSQVEESEDDLNNVLGKHIQFNVAKFNNKENINTQNEPQNMIQLVSVTKKWEDKVIYSPIKKVLPSLNEDHSNNYELKNKTKSLKKKKILMQRENIKEIFSFKRSFLRAVVAYSLVLFCGALAYGFEEELGSFVTITGGLLCVPLAFVYPPLFYLKQKKKEISYVKHFLIGILILTGCIISITSVTMAVLTWETNPRNLACII